MSVTRGKFLKELGKSLPGMLLGGGVAGAAHKVLGKMAAVTGDVGAPPSPKMAKSLPVAAEAAVEFIHHGPATGNKIALTFDDGPTPGITDRILDELKGRGLRATFFMIGERIVEAPDLARRVLAEGHDIGHHTFTHAKLTTLPDHLVEQEIQKMLDAMRDVLGHTPKWFRPPFGALRRNQAPMIARHGMRIVYWNVDPQDWARPGPEKISATVLAHAAAGSIVLCHDVHDQTVEALRPILDGLLDRHLAVATLSDFLE